MMENAISSLAPAIRILLVDDFEPWRRSVRSLLEPYQQLFVVDEAVDGLAGVQKAKELQPDLILLDLALPNLNGIEAARQLGLVAPGSRVLFVSQNNDSELVQAAMSNGVKGYVLKTDAGRELRPAIEAVLEGEKFVSRSLRG